MIQHFKKHDWILGGFEFLHADTTVETDPGSGGAVFAVDAAGATLHPYTKVEFGASGTQTPVSAANPLPVVQTGTPGLPTGAATAAKQPALGTAGSSSTDVLSVQGIASGTAMPVSMASVPSHAVTNAGTFVTQVDGAALTALQLIDNLVLAEDAAHSSGDPGVLTFAVRRDANTSLVGTDGDNAPLQVNADGSLKVAITAGAGSGGTSIADDAAFTPASTSITPVGGIYRSTLDLVDDGDAGAFAMTARRAQHVMLVDSSGTELSAGAQYAEDAAHTTGDSMTVCGAVRRDTAAVGSGTDGDYSTLNVNSSGRLYVTSTVDAALPAGTNNIGDVDVLTLPGAAHDAAISGNPVRVAGRGMSADYTAVTTGDTADLLATLLGKLVTLPYALPGNTWSYAAPAGGLVTTTAVTVKTAAGAGIRNYVTSIQVINSHATISSEIMLLDGAAGTVLWRGWAQAEGGGIACNFNPPLRGTANTLLEIDEVTGTATAGLLVNVQGFVAAE
jgi:hypothetical protein